MRRRLKKQSLVTEINITPFTDVILVLLVIFMIATPLIVQSSIRVNLPQADSANPTEKTSHAYITITNEGLMYLGDEMVTRQALKEKISALHKNNPSLSVVLRADKLVRFKDIVTALDILNEIGVRNLNIAATTEQ
jgi:biopolymer transport protein TolR